MGVVLGVELIHIRGNVALSISLDQFFGRRRLHQKHRKTLVGFLCFWVGLLNREPADAAGRAVQNEAAKGYGVQRRLTLRSKVMSERAEGLQARRREIPADGFPLRAPPKTRPKERDFVSFLY